MAKGKTQIQKFREKARELEADESEERFAETLKKVAKSPPPKNDPKAKKRARR